MNNPPLTASVFTHHDLRVEDPHPHAFIHEPDEPLEVLVKVHALCLHPNPRVLRDALVKSLQSLRPHIDVLLLGYGLCGGGYLLTPGWSRHWQRMLDTDTAKAALQSMTQPDITGAPR